MTIQQEAIMRARIVLIRAKEVLKAVEELNKESDKVWDWAEKHEYVNEEGELKDFIFDEKGLEEYDRIYKALKETLDKAEEEL